MGRYVLDTNHLSGLLDDLPGSRERLYQTLGAGHRVATCVPVLCELQTGLLRTSRRDENRRILAMLLKPIRLWPLEPPLALTYAEIHTELRSRGRVLSQVDIILASLSRSMDATLLTTDRDFEALPDIRVENWLLP